MTRTEIISLKIYAIFIIMMAIITCVFGFVDPWLISQNDDFAVISGVVLAAVTIPVIFCLAVIIIHNFTTLLKPN
jgi:hypothetical protein